MFDELIDPDPDLSSIRIAVLETQIVYLRKYHVAWIVSGRIGLNSQTDFPCSFSQEGANTARISQFCIRMSAGFLELPFVEKMSV